MTRGLVIGLWLLGAYASAALLLTLGLRSLKQGQIRQFAWFGPMKKRAENPVLFWLNVAPALAGGAFLIVLPTTLALSLIG